MVGWMIDVGLVDVDDCHIRALPTRPLTGTTKIAFLDLNNMTRIEVLAGEKDQPSWWRDVYDRRGREIHHMG